jgi:hypothetical protein
MRYKQDKSLTVRCHGRNSHARSNDYYLFTLHARLLPPLHQAHGPFDHLQIVLDPQGCNQQPMKDVIRAHCRPRIHKRRLLPPRQHCSWLTILLCTHIEKSPKHLNYLLHPNIEKAPTTSSVQRCPVRNTPLSPPLSSHRVHPEQDLEVLTQSDALYQADDVLMRLLRVLSAKRLAFLVLPTVEVLLVCSPVTTFLTTAPFRYHDAS